MMSVTLDDVDYIPLAIKKLNQAIKENPNDAGAHYNRSLFLLSQGFFENGWPEYDWRIAKGKAGITHDVFPVKRWEGESLAGQHVLVWLEQGIGDQILQASILPDLLNVAASVTLKCHRRIADLLQRSFPTVDVVKFGKKPGQRYREMAFDCQMAFGELGRRFRKTFEDFPQQVSYLTSADPDKFRNRYYRGKPLVGISWHSRLNGQVGHAKGMSLGELIPVLQNKNATFVSLQYGDVSEIEEIRKFGVDLIHDPEIDPLVDTDTFASQVAAMNHVVSISNTTVHFASALGIPTTMLLARSTQGVHSRHWYWFAGFERSPWYQYLDIVRQEKSGEWWKPVRVAAERISRLPNIARTRTRLKAIKTAA